MTDKTELEVTAGDIHYADLIETMLSVPMPNTRRHELTALLARHRLATRTPDPTPVAWMPIESAPKDEPILAAIKVQNNKAGASWWERHIIVIDSETGTISDMDYHHGWEADDYEGWQPLPSAPGDAPVPPAVPADGLVDAVTHALHILENAPDLNPSNYDHDDAILVNTASNEAWAVLDTALAAYRGEA